MWNNKKALQTHQREKLTTYFVWLTLIFFTVLISPAHAAFSTVDCTDASHLSTLDIPQMEVMAMQ